MDSGNPLPEVPAGECLEVICSIPLRDRNKGPGLQRVPWWPSPSQVPLHGQGLQGQRMCRPPHILPGVPPRLQTHP